MRGWAIVYGAGALLAGLGSIALPEGMWWVAAIIVFFVFVVALLLLGLALTVRSSRN